MNLRTRISVAVVTVSAIGTLVLGSAAIFGLRAIQVGHIDSNLRAIAAQTLANGQDPVSEATLAVDDSPIPTALGFVAGRTEPAWLRTLASGDVASPTSAFIATALQHPQSTEDGYRMLGIGLQNGEQLLLAASLATIDQEARNNLLRILLLWLPFNAALAVFISFFVSRNIRHMEQLVVAASDIASGVADVEVPQEGTSNEARALAHALDRVVLSLRQALESERASNQRMQEFLGDASHELRTPLTVLKGYLELLERSDGLDEAQRERALDRMRTEAGRMELLVNDLLLLAEIGSTQPEDLVDVDVTGLVRVLAEDFQILQPERTVTTNIESGVTIKAISTHLHRAIANAIANIRRHTPADAAVHVDLHATATDVLLTIEDGGPGLPPEQYERGIAHFQRFDKSRSRATGGSGLGMSIIAAVTQELGGTVELRPSRLGGLAVHFRLPRTSA